MENNDLVFLKNFATLSEAELAKNLLETEGILSILQRGNLGAIVEFAGAAGDADLFVKRKDYKRAKEILESGN